MFKLFFDSSSSVEHYLDDAVDMPVGRPRVSLSSPKRRASEERI